MLDLKGPGRCLQNVYPCGWEMERVHLPYDLGYLAAQCDDRKEGKEVTDDKTKDKSKKRIGLGTVYKKTMRIKYIEYQDVNERQEQLKWEWCQRACDK